MQSLILVGVVAIIILCAGVLMLAVQLSWLLSQTCPETVRAQVHDEIARTNPTIGRGAIIKLIDDRVRDEVNRKFDEPLSVPKDGGEVRLFEPEV